MAGLKPVSFTSPYAAEENEILRRQKMAELLQQQSMAPTNNNEMAGGWVIRKGPWEGLAKAAQGLFGGLSQQQADEKRKELLKQMQGDYSADRSAMMTALQGKPADPGVDDPTAGYSPPIAAQAPNPQALQTMDFKSPMFQQIQAQNLMQQLKPREPRVVGEGGVLLGPDNKPIFENKKDFKPDKPADKWGEPYNLNGALVQKNEANGQIRTAVTREPQVRVHQEAPITAVTLQDPNDPNGTIVVDGRTNRVLGKGPKLTDAGKLENKRQFNMTGIGQTIQEAEELLTGKSGKALPTGSGVGTAVDFAAGLVGASPSGAAEATTLKAIGGALVSKMPRMEGPQSDKDVMLYKEMAGKVGDSTVPRAQRIAALEKVKDLWAKYERLNPGAFADRRTPDEPPAGAVRPRGRP